MIEEGWEQAPPPQKTGPVSPAVQVRISLKRSRSFGRDFEEAWEAALSAVRWPHDTTHRREWKDILRDPSCREAWRTAYYGEECEPRQLAVARLIAAG